MKNTSTKYLIENGTVVTMDPQRRVLDADILISNSRIEAILLRNASSNEERKRRLQQKNLRIARIDAKNQFVIPGLIQTHIHLCQVLFRGMADDLALLDWLKKRIWPFERAHTPRSLQASARLGALELQLTGTTSILDMGTVRHTQPLLEAVAQTGLRYWGGKCLMDDKKTSGPLYEKTISTIRETEALVHEWKGKNPLIEYALCPRFVISCTPELLKVVRFLQERYDLIVHTHASENKDEVKIVKQRTGMNNVSYLDSLGLLNSRTVIAHGIHITKNEIHRLAKTCSHLVHCPSSNLKLGSGIARIHEYRKQKVSVGIGADGAPCSNTLDAFLEMRLAALLQKPLVSPTAVPAREALELATVQGAKILGREKDLGSLEIGKLADIVTVDRSHPSVCTVQDPYSALIYSCTGRDVKNVFIHGRPIVLDGRHKYLNETTVKEEAIEELSRLKTRI